MKKLLLLLLVSALFSGTGLVQAQQSNADSRLKSISEQQSSDSLSIFSLLDKMDEEALSVTIKSNFQRLITRKFKEEYQAATFSFVGPDGDSIQFDIKIKTRGNSRKQICFYPPLKMKFKKSSLREEGLLPFDKYKLVTQCKPGSTYEEYIMKEYLTYKLMEQTYPYAFKVRMLDITYIDERNNGKIKEQKRLGFIIESEEELAQRYNAHVIERSKSGFHHLERIPALQMSLSQYMIGNTDWAMPNLHNMMVLKVPEYEKLVPLPYDFDYCGLVDTDYAVVHESLSIKDVKERLYIGPSCEEREALALMKEFLGRKQAILDCINSFEMLDERERRKMVSYLADFFEALESENLMKRVLNY
jgi:hypothetical protein